MKKASEPLGQKYEKSAVKINGAVSPAARATERTTPVAIGVNAIGNVMWAMVTNLEAPTPSAPLRRLSGTSFRPSSVVFITVGNIRIESATPPAMALYELPRMTREETIIS